MIQYAVRVREQSRLPARLGGFFLAGDVLVPVPRSSPKTGGTWVAAELAQALVHAGPGSDDVAGTAPDLRGAQIGNLRARSAPQRRVALRFISNGAAGVSPDDAWC